MKLLTQVDRKVINGCSYYENYSRISESRPGVKQGKGDGDGLVYLLSTVLHSFFFMLRCNSY